MSVSVAQTEYNELKERAWRYLRKGLIVLVICMAIAYFASENEFLLHNVIMESAIIFGWVALWHPIEMFLYDLPELKEKIKK